jgi:hypothetical protein
MAKFLSQNRTRSVKGTKPTNSKNTFTLIDIHGHLRLLTQLSKAYTGMVQDKRHRLLRKVFNISAGHLRGHGFDSRLDSFLM